MYTISIDEIEEGELHLIEIVVAGKRRISIDLNKHNTTVQIPGGLKPFSMNNTAASFFGRTNDVD